MGWKRFNINPFEVKESHRVREMKLQTAKLIAFRRALRMRKEVARA
jgi:hypothetical protein